MSQGTLPVTLRRCTPQSPWDYSALLEYQAQVVTRILAGGSGELLLSELAPVITLGRSTQPQDVWASSAELEQRGITSLAVSRGGRATYHGPGQWVLFPVERLERLVGDPRGVRKVVEALLEAARDTARAFDVSAEIREGAEAGVWTQLGKLASVGIRVENGIAQHGLALNVYRTPHSFYGLHPCGLQAKADFLFSDEGIGRLRFEEVGSKLTERFRGKLFRVP